MTTEKKCPRCGSTLWPRSEDNKLACHNDYCELNVPANQQLAAAQTLGVALRFGWTAIKIGFFVTVCVVIWRVLT